jgi:glucan-binding YG repeat protein
VPEDDPNYGEYQEIKRHFANHRPEEVDQQNQELQPLAGGSLTPIPRNGAVLRLAILSDTHSGWGDMAITKFNNALATFNTIAQDTDAVFILGDLVCYNTQEEITPILEEVIRPLPSLFSDRKPLHLLMGNHDFVGQWDIDSFETTYGRYLRNYQDPSYAADSTAVLTSDYGQKQNAAVIIRGIPIIKLCPQNYTNNYDYRYLYSFLSQKLAQARAYNGSSGKPILVMAHHPMKGAWVNDSYDCGNYGSPADRDMTALLAQYPEVVFLAGHIHNFLQMPQSINQDLGFTLVHTATTGADFWLNNVVIEADWQLSQGLLLDVLADNKVRITRIEFGCQCYIGSTWEFLPSDASSASAPFLIDPRRAQARSPQAEPATLTIQNTAKGIVVDFIQGTRFINDDNAFVYSYQLEILEALSGKPLVSRSSFSDFFRGLTTSNTYSLESGARVIEGDWDIRLTTRNAYGDTVKTTTVLYTANEPRVGWVDSFEGRRYYHPDSGTIASGWVLIDGIWYYFDPGSFLAKRGWLKHGGAWYYLDPLDGHMLEGWKSLDNWWYYLIPESGRMASGWQKIKDKWYYLIPGSGRMASGWQRLGGAWFYLDTNKGHMLEGWQRINGQWYYLIPGSGRMATGWQRVNSQWYYLTPGNGHMATGWRRLGGRWYYLTPGSGRMATEWQKLGGAWYYLTPGSGYMATGWRKIDGAWYYFYEREDGRMATGTLSINGTVYVFDSSGALTE